MTDEVSEYFHRQYEKSKVRVVPGHWPKFKSKKQVDLWIKLINSMVDDCFTQYLECPRCKNEDIREEQNYCQICGFNLKERNKERGK